MTDLMTMLRVSVLDDGSKGSGQDWIVAWAAWGKPSGRRRRRGAADWLLADKSHRRP